MTEPIVSPTLQILMEEFTRSGAYELHLRSGDFELYLSSDPAAGKPQISSTPRASRASQAAVTPRTEPASQAVATVTSENALPEAAIVVRAPNLGTFYRAPKPGAQNYVEVGDQVSVGSEICLIEVMKLFTAVQSDLAGTVHAILAEDGAMVEAGQPLFALVND